jgi:iron complex outermembrane recepter protein
MERAVWEGGSARRMAVASAVALALVSMQATAAMTVAMLADMSLEELANIEVTSVSKKAERLADAPASIYVITAEDIRRSGAATLPDALRLAPNLQVAQNSASGYAITARGFNGSNNSAPNKLLVMIDGRSVYTPLFSGVFWDTQIVMLEDVERIEVISGPGGTLWGVNAVNGVINVITRAASETQGTLVSVTGGNLGSNVAARYGGKLGEDGSYRVYVKQAEREHMRTEAGTAITDGWHRKQAGFRADWASDGERISVHGNAYDGATGQAAPGSLSLTGTTFNIDTISISGMNLTARWEHLLDDGGSFSVQGYYDHTKRDIPPIFGEKLDIIDLQFQHSLKRMGAHTPVWGLNYRYAMDDVSNNMPGIAFLPAQVDQKWVSLFAQDEIALRENVELTLGVRAERNPYTGTEFLPSARLAWKPAPEHMLWTAASRTVRAPSRLDRDLYIPSASLAGGPNMRTEVAKVYELGYRGQFSSNLTYSVTAYHADYDHLQTLALYPPAPSIPTAVVFANDMEGEADGIEMWGSWQVRSWWRLSAGFTHLNENLWLKPGGIDATAPQASGKNPERTGQLRAAFTLSPRHELDIAVRHVSALDSPDPVPAYNAIDARFGWKIQRDLDLSVIGYNLFGTQHAEYGPRQYRSVIPSGVFARLTWQF